MASSEYARERAREQRERLEHLGLSEVEAVEYVLMLSRDEANANVRADGKSEAGASEVPPEEDQGMFEGDFDIEHNTDNDEEDDYNRSYTHSTVSGSRRSSTSSTSIPMVWSSSHSSSSLSSSSASLSSRPSHSNLTTMTRNTATGLTTIAMRRSIPCRIPSSSNEKLQVSPPFIADPMEAGQEWSVDYNAVSSPSRDTNTCMREDIEHLFPPIIPGKSGNPAIEAQESKREDEEKEKTISKGKKKRNRNREDIIERKDKSQGRGKATTATTAEISSPSPHSKRISAADVGINRSVNQKALTSSSPSSSPTSSTLASAWNIPLCPGQNYGQRRGSSIPSPSSTSTSASAAPRNAWTSGGPNLSARISPPSATAATSLHHHQQQQSGRWVSSNTNSNRDEDEDLKFAIELSLVEARRRGEDV